MAETLVSIVKEAKRNKYSLTKKLSEDDIIVIWEGASEFVQKQMLHQKGVAINGLGVFTFSQKKLNVGNNKFIIIMHPVFVLSEKLVQTHSLQVTKQHTSGQIPIVPLNFTTLSNESSFTRDTIEMSIKDILLALSRTLAAKKNIQLDFGKIGRLLITDGKVKMRFFKELISSLDKSGNMESIFRPGTTSSILSIISSSKAPRPSTTLPSLPKIVKASGEDALSLDCATPRPISGGTTCSNKLELIVKPEDSVSQQGRDSMSSEEEEPNQFRKHLSGKQNLVPKPAMLFTTKDHPPTQSASLPEDQSPSISFEPASVEKSNKETKKGEEETKHLTSGVATELSTCSHTSPSGQELCYLCHQRALRNVAVDMSTERREREKRDDQMLQKFRYQQDLVYLAKELMNKTNNRAYNREIASLNLEAAQAQQAKRAVKSSEFHPSYVFPHRKSTPAKHFKQTEYCSQLDSQVEYVKNKKEKIQQLEDRLEREEQVKLSEELGKFQKEYSKQKTEKMLQYQRALAEQAAIKQELNSLWNHCNITSTPHHPDSLPNKPLSGSKLGPFKLRPLSLPTPTIILPFSQSKQMTVLKDCNMKMVSLKPTHLLSINEDKAVQHVQQPLFGVHNAEFSPDQLRDQKERSRRIFLEQLKMAASKQQAARERVALEKEEEAEMLKQTRKGLIEDIRAGKKHKLETRKALERSWDINIKEKHKRALEELAHIKKPSSLLVQQQCDRYQRCNQCQRAKGNKGKSNLLCETRYISGARLMV